MFSNGWKTLCNKQAIQNALTKLCSILSTFQNVVFILLKQNLLYETYFFFQLITFYLSKCTWWKLKPGDCWGRVAVGGRANKSDDTVWCLTYSKNHNTNFLATFNIRRFLTMKDFESITAEKCIF